MAIGKTSSKIKPIKNPLEVISDFGNGSIGKIAKGFLGESKTSASIAIDQLLGIDLSSSKTAEGQDPAHQSEKANTALAEGGKLTENEWLILAKAKSPSEKRAQQTENSSKSESHKQAALDYHGEIVKSSERANREELSEMSNKIREIMSELKKLVNSSSALQIEFSQVAVEDAPVNVGKYHANFFEWMLIVIRNAREKVDDSNAWLGTVKGKNGKKSGYWGMFKAHGTSFGLSGERSVATQTG